MAEIDRSEIRLDATDTTGKAFKSAQANMRNLASSAAVLEGPLGQVAGRINAIGAALGRMNPLLLLGGVAIAGLTVGLGKAVSAASEFEQQTLRLNQLVEATGYSAGLTAEQMDALAYSTAEATLASQQGVRDAISILTTYTSITNDNFSRTITLAQDYASVFGGDVASAVTKFGRALDNPREGLQTLARQLTVFTSAQRDMIATMFESGKEVEAQEMILSALEARLGGAATAQAGGLAGALDTTGERFTKLFQILGENSGLLSATDKFFRGVAEGIKRLNEQLEPDIDKQLSNSQERLDALRAEIKSYEELQQQIGKLPRSQQLAFDRAYTFYQKELQINKDLLVVKDQQIAKEKEAARAAELLREQRIKEREEERLAEERKKRLVQLNKEAKKVTEETQTPQERFNSELEHLNELLIETDLTTEAASRKIAMLGHEMAKASGQDFETQQKALQKLKDNEEALLDASTFGPDGSPDLRRRLDVEFEIRVENASRLAELARESGADELEITQSLNTQIEAAERIHQANLNRLAVQGAEIRRQAWSSATDNIVGLFQVLGQRSKAFAVAAIALEKGKAISEIFINTEIAAAKALATLGPIAGAPVASSVRLAGKVSMAAVAATGLAQVANLSSGGGNQVVQTAPRETSLGPQSIINERERGVTTIQFIGDFYGWDDYIEERVVNGIRDAVDNRDVIILGSSSRNAQELISQ